MQKRDVAVAIILSLITCGIYSIYWLIKINDELNELYGSEDMSGGLVFLFSLISCGLFLIYWSYKAGTKVDALKERRGQKPDYSGILFLILSIFGLDIVNYALIQDEINHNIPSKTV